MISKLEYYFPAAGLSQNDMLHLIKGFDVSFIFTTNILSGPRMFWSPFDATRNL